MAEGKHIILHVSGMFCENCERRIEKALNDLPGVSDVSARFPAGIVSVHRNPMIVTDDALRAAVESAGYTVTNITGEDSGSSKTPDRRGVQIASILIILLGLYVIAQHLGLTKIFNIFPRVEESLSLGMVFVIGLLTSAHCIAMCGGINLTQSTVSVRSNGKVLKANAAYNLGRMISYSIVGGIAGAIGSVLTLGGALRGAIAILAGAIMLLMSLRMLGLLKSLPSLHLPFFSRISAKAGGSSFLIGLLNGLMPCGPLQAMQIYALSTGSIFSGALSMFLFAAGTVPLMFGFGAFAGRLNQKYSRYMLTVCALLIFVMGLNMAGTGLALSGVNIPSGSRPVSQSASQASGGQVKMATVHADVQTIETEIDYGTFPAIQVRAGLPVEWTIHVPEGTLNGCNGEIIVPSYDLDIVLSEGDNMVHFTPEAPGTVPYSCWMGMIKSYIEVTE